MYWSQDETLDTLAVPDTIVDCLFAIECRALPVDHAYALSSALVAACPWIGEEPGLGIHTVHVAGSQNGWERPAHGTESQIQLSRRTKLILRLPRARAPALLDALPGTRIEVAGAPLTVGAGKLRSLGTESVLFARYLVSTAGPDEEAFMNSAAQALALLGIQIRKALCGKSNTLETPNGAITTRSLLLAGLKPDESLRLQQQGLGLHRLMGCGIFIPHKGIDAVGKAP
jgi:CRISPR-associated protein Cas6